MEQLEAEIAEWRAFVGRARRVDGRDVEELEAHLRDQIADLDAAGLAADEAFLVAVKRMGAVDELSREFAREHSGRLWRQLVLSDGDEHEAPDSRWPEALAFAVAAAVTIQVARLAAGFPNEESWWLLRNASLLVLPFLAGYFARRRRLPLRQSSDGRPVRDRRRPDQPLPVPRGRVDRTARRRRTCPSCCGSWSPTRT